MTCHMVGMITNVQIFGGPAPRKFGRAKTSKFGTISRDFWVWPRMSQKSSTWDVKNREQIWSRAIPGGLAKKLCELWSTNKKVISINVDLTKSTMHVLRMLMHLSLSMWLCYVGNFTPPPKFFPQSDLGCRLDSRWALPQMSSFPMPLAAW